MSIHALIQLSLCIYWKIEKYISYRSDPDNFFSWAVVSAKKTNCQQYSDNNKNTILGLV